MNDFGFKEQDKEQLVKFLNMIANKGRFNLTVDEVIQFRNYLAWAQHELLNKIDKSIVEVVNVKNVEEEKKKRQSRAKQSKGQSK